MKIVLTAIFLMFNLLASHAARSLERISIAGSDYVRLSEWADLCDFKTRWITKDEMVEVTGRSVRLSFTVDPRKGDPKRSEINGVAVLLSLPAVLRGGVPFVSTLDLRTTIQPLLFPQKTSSARVKTICLDAGHGGRDTGKIDKKNLEKDFTLLLVQEVASLLRQNNFKVVLTRSTDKTVDLTERPSIARRSGADLFVSLHYNAGNSDAHGVETYCLTPAGVNSSNAGGGRAAEPGYAGNVNNDSNILLAYSVQKSIAGAVSLDDRGVKRSRFEVLRDARMPAILVEGGFMSNAAEAKKIYDAAFRKNMAQAIVNGILAYKKLVEPAAPKNS
jgi:N-acetylmuramoyl-L-alanine amidase